MQSSRSFVRHLFSSVGGCLLPSLFLLSNALADTIELKNGRHLKGLVVERHVDRIILSTEKGEIPILLAGIKNIEYDEPEQNFMQIGKAYEAENKLGEALAYYEKALELNPDFEEARKAATAVRNRFWAKSAEGPRDEMEKKQLLYDSWGTGESFTDAPKKRSAEQAERLKGAFGMTLEKKGDWVRIQEAFSKKDAAEAGLKKNDRLVTFDGESLRYLGAEAIARKMLEGRFSNFTLEIERDCFLDKKKGERDLKRLGVKLKLTYEGVLIDEVVPGTPAAEAGLKAEDFLTAMDGVPTRYLPMKKISEMLEKNPKPGCVFTVRRSVFLTRSVRAREGL